MRLRIAGSSLPWKRLLAEFLAIVTGVLVALAVDSWWERHEERNRAEEYLEQLVVDFEETGRRLQGSIDAETERVEVVNGIVDRALHGPLPPADSLDLPTGFNIFSPLVGTLTALIQSGDLRLLRSDSIRFELIAYSALIDDVETMLRHSEGLVWNSTERVALGRARYSRAGTSGAGWGELDVRGALGDPEIISALQIQTAASQIRIFNLSRLRQPTERIIRLIRAELDEDR